MIKTKVTVAGVTFDDYQNARVTRSTSDFNSSSDYTIRYDSPFGRHDNDFTVGNEIKIFADQDAEPTTNIFTGIVERIKFIGKGAQQKVELRGRDYSLRLQDITVEPVVYTDSEISTIVIDVINNNVPDDITTNNVDVTDTTLKRIAFNHLSVFEALTELAVLAGFMFYVDEDKDLHFEKKENVSSGISLDNSNITDMVSNQTREGMANSIWVYGDRQLTGVREVLNNDGSAWGGAPSSEFILTYKPHNTEVSILGSVKIGGVLGMTETTTSGIQDYFVNFEDRKIITISGTQLGYSTTPPSGGSILMNYDRDVPIVKQGDDDASISLYGKKVKVINDKTIKDPDTATAILQKELELSDPFRGMELTYTGWASITPGNTVSVTLANFGLDEVIVGILSVEYNFDKNKVNSEKVIRFKLDRKILDITDQITDIRKRLTSIEAQDRQTSDIVTRLKQTTGSMMLIGSYWQISTKTMGSSFVLGNQSTGSVDGIGGIRLGTLGSETGSISFLGDSRSPFTIITSGGYNY